MTQLHSPQRFAVGPEQAQQTLASALRQWLPGQSWKQVRRLVDTRRIEVNRNLCLDQARRLTEGELVEVLAEPLAPLPADDDVFIRHLDRHVVVVEKPAGLTSVRHAKEADWPTRRKELQPTLQELLAKKLAERRGRSRERGSRNATKVRAVHRLDRDTSGLMVFALSREAEESLIQQFRKHSVQRTYLAVVVGRIEAQTIVSHLVRNRGDGRRGSVDNVKIGKRAVTHVEPLESLGDYSLVQCQLETGRTHQIRIHLSELGHPVCGDKIYRAGNAEPNISDPIPAPRQALHAHELAFEHPVSSARLPFRMPLPNDLAMFIERLRGNA